jgi:hypothetical protein
MKIKKKEEEKKKTQKGVTYKVDSTGCTAQKCIEGGVGNHRGRKDPFPRVAHSDL